MEYCYEDLSCRDEIRILVLSPAASFDDDLHARIIHRTYPIEEEDASGVNYWNAASYTWGLDPPSKTLYIDSTFPKDPNGGRTIIKITPNVDSMMRHLRDEHQEHNLWIDAICLNQRSTPEKNQQVRRMEWIYRLALQVLVWLGDDDGTVRVGMKLIEGLGNFLEKPLFANDPSAINAVGASLMEQLCDQKPHALERLFHRPWFGRRWILQEVALARQAIVCCGRYQLPWDNFRAGMEFISRIQGGNILFHSRLMDDESARSIRTLLKLNRISGHFLDLLWSFDASACKVEHDVIYALSGLVTDGISAPQDKEVASSISLSIGSDVDLERFAKMASSMRGLDDGPGQINVDYDEPWNKVFTQVAAWYVRKTAFAALTRHLFAFGSLHERNGKWPSWVPDWSRPRRPEPKKGMSNVVPWAGSIEVVDDTLKIHARKLCTTRNILAEFPASRQGFRDSVKRLLQGTDTILIATEARDMDGDSTRDLTVSEMVVGDLIRSGLDVGLCKPVPAESDEITEAWIVNDLASQAIARAIFTPEWRAGNGGFLDGIITCLQGTSLFVTNAMQLGISAAKLQDGDQIVLIDDYHGLPELDHRPVEGIELQAAAVLRPVEPQQEDHSKLSENAKFYLVGPCIVARSHSEVVLGGDHILLV